jgi:hypothetical protein
MLLLVTIRRLPAALAAPADRLNMPTWKIVIGRLSI